MAKGMKMDSSGYGTNPADGPKLDEYGNMIKAVLSPGSKARRASNSRAELAVPKKNVRQKAIRAALDKMRAKRTQIPASPTK